MGVPFSLQQGLWKGATGEEYVRRAIIQATDVLSSLLEWRWWDWLVDKAWDRL